MMCCTNPQQAITLDWSISTSTQDASVSGCMTAALSDYLFSAVI